MKREKRTTKKERKSLQGGATGVRPNPKAAAAPQQGHDHAHIHCIACGKHLEADDFGEPNGPSFYRCQHGGDFPHCAGCAAPAKELVDEHDRTGKPVKKAALWH